MSKSLGTQRATEATGAISFGRVVYEEIGNVFNGMSVNVVPVTHAEASDRPDRGSETFFGDELPPDGRTLLGGLRCLKTRRTLRRCLSGLNGGDRDELARS